MRPRAPKSGRRVFPTSNGVFIADPEDVLGRGTYGVVYRVRHEKDPSIKKAVKTFCPETMDESEGIPSTTLREINALKTISHPNVMTAEEVVIPTEQSLTDMFVVMELCKGTLKDKIIEMIQGLLGSNNAYVKPEPGMRLPSEYIKEAKIVAWQLLNSLAVVHSRGIMHRDLKPVNIMWGFDGLLKLGDFGLARFVRGNQNSNYNVVQQTGEVQTMWYRAPEVLLGDDKYGLLVDDWSIGCVIAELFRFRRSSSGRMEPDPLFHGRSDVETLMIVFETIGTPQPSKCEAAKYLAELPYWSSQFPRWFDGTLRSRVQLIDDDGYDLLSQLLKISPSERRAARFLLDHKWFDDVRAELQQFVPWYRGFEKDYVRLAGIDRLPPARLIKDVDAALAAKKCSSDSSATTTRPEGAENQTCRTTEEARRAATAVDTRKLYTKGGAPATADEPGVSSTTGMATLGTATKVPGYRSRSKPAACKGGPVEGQQLARVALSAAEDPRPGNLRAEREGDATGKAATGVPAAAENSSHLPLGSTAAAVVPHIPEQGNTVPTKAAPTTAGCPAACGHRKGIRSRHPKAAAAATVAEPSESGDSTDIGNGRCYKRLPTAPQQKLLILHHQAAVQQTGTGLVSTHSYSDIPFGARVGADAGNCGPGNQPLMPARDLRHMLTDEPFRSSSLGPVTEASSGSPSVVIVGAKQEKQAMAPPQLPHGNNTCGSTEEHQLEDGVDVRMMSAPKSIDDTAGNSVSHSIALTQKGQANDINNRISSINYHNPDGACEIGVNYAPDTDMAVARAPFADGCPSSIREVSTTSNVNSSVGSTAAIANVSNNKNKRSNPCVFADDESLGAATSRNKRPALAQTSNSESSPGNGGPPGEAGLTAESWQSLSGISAQQLSSTTVAQQQWFNNENTIHHHQQQQQQQRVGQPPTKEPRDVSTYHLRPASTAASVGGCLNRRNNGAVRTKDGGSSIHNGHLQCKQALQHDMGQSEFHAASRPGSSIILDGETKAAPEFTQASANSACMPGRAVQSRQGAARRRPGPSAPCGDNGTGTAGGAADGLPFNPIRRRRIAAATAESVPQPPPAPTNATGQHAVSVQANAVPAANSYSLDAGGASIGTRNTGMECGIAHINCDPPAAGKNQNNHATHKHGKPSYGSAAASSHAVTETATKVVGASIWRASAGAPVPSGTRSWDALVAEPADDPSQNEIASASLRPPYQPGGRRGRGAPTTAATAAVSRNQSSEANGAAMGSAAIGSFRTATTAAATVVCEGGIAAVARAESHVTTLRRRPAAGPARRAGVTGSTAAAPRRVGTSSATTTSVPELLATESQNIRRTNYQQTLAGTTIPNATTLPCSS